MKIVHKYALSALTEISILGFIKPTLVGMQNHQPHIWIEHELEEPGKDQKVSKIKVMLIPTGIEIPNGMIHAGSFQNGAYVWHCYYTL